MEDSDTPKLEPLKEILSAAENDLSQKAMRFLIKRFSDEKREAAMIAAENGYMNVLAVIIEEYETNQEDLGSFLMSAVDNNKLDAVELLIDAGADVNKQNGDGYTALMSAAKHGYNNVLEVLLQKKERDLEVIDNKGNTALMSAVYNNNLAAVKLLIEAGADINKQNRDGYTALMIAAEHGYNHVLKKLLSKKGKIKIQLDEIDNKGYTALMLAVDKNNLDAVKLLINKGADINKQNMNGYAALMLAAKHGYNNVLEVLLQKKERDLEVIDNKGNTALILAVYKNNLAAVKLLIEAGADINKQPPHGYTALMIAVYNNNLDAVKLLIKAKADINKQNRDGYTALMIAAWRNNPDAVKSLIKAGADINKQNRDGYTALMFAAVEGYNNVLEALLSKKARIDLEIIDKNGNTALILAIFNHRSSATKLLIDEGADINKQTPHGYTALMIATVEGYNNVLEVLLSKKDRINLNEREYGHTALMLAAYNNNPDAVELLIEAGADINQQNSDGETALMIAVADGYVNIVVLLIKAGANIDDKDKYGKTLFMTAVWNFRSDVIEALIKYGAIRVYSEGRPKQAWEVYPAYFTKENLLAIFQEAIHEGEIKVLLNLYSEPVYRDTLLQADENTQAKFKDVYNFLNEYGFPPKEPVLKAAQAIKFQLLIFAEGINAILLHFTGKTIRLDAANSHLKMILKTVFASAQRILPIILEYADWQDQWYNARQIIEEYLKVCEPKIKIIAGADLNALQESFGFDEIIKQEISARFQATLDRALLFPNFQSLRNRDQNNAELLVLLKLIAQTCSYKIIVSLDGTRVDVSVQNPTHSYKFYYHSQEQLMLLQEIAHSPPIAAMDIEEVVKEVGPSVIGKRSHEGEQSASNKKVKQQKSNDVTDVTRVYSVTSIVYGNLILRSLTPDVIELIGKENFSKILQMPEWMSEEFAKRVKEKGVLKAVEEITNNNNAEQHSVEEAISQAYAFNTGEDIKPIIQDYYSKLLPKFGDMSQFEADMLLLGTLADKTQQNIVLRSVDNITGTVYHQLIGNAENQQAPIFIDVNENGYFSKKDFSYLLGPKPETLHVDDSLKPLEIMPETDYFSSFASLSALFVFMFYYSDGLQ